jgi:hypothetical protein
MSKQPTAGRGISTRLRTAKGRTGGSQRWLERQLNDPYVRAAQAAGYRSRAAFKLLEMDERAKLLRPGARIVDLGAAPGGWTQVAVAKAGQGGRVVALDLLAMDPVAGATVLQGDFQDPAAIAAVREAMIASRLVRVNLVIRRPSIEPHGYAGPGHMVLGLPDRIFAEMEDRGRQHRCRMALGHARHQMVEIANAA